MKKKLTALALALAFVLSAATGCGSKSASSASSSGTSSSAKTVTLTVGASPTPHAEILKQCVAPLKKEGVNLKIVEFTDYVQPNTALESGDLDANYFQHTPYLDDFNKKHGTHLVALAKIHYEPFGIYAGKTSAIDKLPDGAKISVPNDGTNEARALLLLEKQGIIKLKDSAGFDATKLDIKDNPKHVEIVEMEAAQLVKSRSDVELAVINGNYALQGGLNAAKDALATEAADSDSAQTYANIIAVKKGNEKNEAVQKLIEVLHSKTIQDYITSNYSGAVVPIQ
jgi:D-methionine transport system substrate-binding protein